MNRKGLIEPSSSSSNVCMYKSGLKYLQEDITMLCI